MTHYKICHHSITFNIGFNEPLDQFYTIIRFFTTVIFPDSFNQPFTLTKQIIHLRLGKAFTHSIILTKNLITVFFESKFNSPLATSKNLKQLYLGFQFNHPISAPKNMYKITFGDKYNQPFILNKQLLFVHFGANQNIHIKLPKNISHVNLGHHFNQSIIFTKRLTVITFGHFYEQHCAMDNILTLEHVNIDTNDHFVVDNIPNSVQVLMLGEGCYLPLPLDNVPNNTCVKYEE